MQVLKVDNVSRSFKDFSAISNVTFDISEREIVSLVGPNGAGKTTLIKIICGILEPTQGKTTINSDTVGVVFGGDKGFYNNISAYENLKFFGRLKRIKNLESSVIEALKRVKLYDVMDKNVSTYSRGMKQRLHIARGILDNPKLIILDEPTIGLDADIVRELQELLLQLKKEGTSILLTSHNLNEIERLSDKVVIIGAGAVHFIGTINSLKSKYNTDTLEETYLHIAKELER